MPPPGSLPIGLHLNQAARIVGQAFDDALTLAGGSLPIWLVLVNLKSGRPANQRALAAAVGIREATLTHHLNGMEQQGLITRVRDTANRRIHVVGLTASGEQLFRQLRKAALGFDERLNRGVSAVDRRHLAGLLDQLVANVGNGARATPPWATEAQPTPDRG
jgi:MarR family transcriptional regulator for hemolysin